MFFGMPKRAREINAEMIQDLEKCVFVRGATREATIEIYLETRLMILHCQPRTRQTQRSIRAIYWLMKYEYGLVY